jgi:hypothetical protein
VLGVDLVYHKDTVVDEVLDEHVPQFNVFASLGDSDACSHTFAGRAVRVYLEIDFVCKNFSMEILEV